MSIIPHKRSKSIKKASSKKAIKTIGSKSQVFKGTAVKTVGGLTKKDIKKITDEDGKNRYVSAKKSKMQKYNPWIAATMVVRQELKDQGVNVPVIMKKTGTAEQKNFYSQTVQLFDAMKEDDNIMKSVMKRAKEIKRSK